MWLVITTLNSISKLLHAYLVLDCNFYWYLLNHLYFPHNPYPTEDDTHQPDLKSSKRSTAVEPILNKAEYIHTKYPQPSLLSVHPGAQKDDRGFTQVAEFSPPYFLCSQAHLTRPLRLCPYSLGSAHTYVYYTLGQCA